MYVCVCESASLFTCTCVCVCLFVSARVQLHASVCVCARCRLQPPCAVHENTSHIQQGACSWKNQYAGDRNMLERSVGERLI